MTHIGGSGVPSTQSRSPLTAAKWLRLVSTVRASWLSIPSRERANAVIFTADYSEAAVNEFGRGTGLPTAYTGPRHPWGQMRLSLRHYD